MNYPKTLKGIIDFYKSLPGIGEKNAIRMAINTYESNDDRINEFISNLQNMRINVKKCSICGMITDNDVCDICSDTNRDDNLICVLEDYKNLFNFEKNNIFKGKYHILGGLISPMDGVNPEDLNIHSLVERIKKLHKPEVIIALTSSIEGEMTMLYLKNILDKYDVKISRLSYGVPLGMNLDYMDMISLNKALEDRREIDN